MADISLPDVSAQNSPHFLGVEMLATIPTYLASYMYLSRK